MAYNSFSSDPTPDVSSSHGLLRVVSNKQLVETEKAAEREEQRQAETPEISTLSAYIEECWQENKQYKEQSGIEDDMIKSLRQRNNEYEPDKLSEIQEMGGSQVFAGLTDTKCTAAEAWINDILASELEKPWEVRPTPEPEVPEDLEQTVIAQTMMAWQMELAKGNILTPDKMFAMAGELRDETERKLDREIIERAHRMDTKIYDQMVEGDWIGAFDDFVTNMVGLGLGIIKGPIIRKKMKKSWGKNEFGKTKLKLEPKITMDFQSVSPFDAYPSPSSVEIDDGNFIERMKLTRKSLVAMKDVEGYDSDAIDLVLTRYGQGEYKTWTSTDQERSELEKHGDRVLATKDSIEALDFWGSVQGKYLIEHSMTEDLDGNSIEPLREYDINSIKIDDILIYSVINPEPLGGKPYSKTGYRKITGSFWYKGVAVLMRDFQNICNATLRHLMNNLAIASGPQVVYEDINRLPPGEKISRLFPWKTHQLQNPGNSTLPGVRFDQPDSNAAELLTVYKKFADEIDELTGIPSYEHGQGTNIGGAGRTLGGLSLLMGSAARGIKKIIARVHKKVISTTIQRMYEWYMLYDPDESLKGDIEIYPMGVLAMIIQEQMSMRRTQFLQTTNNPVDLQLMGLEGRAELLRKQAESLDMERSKLVKSAEDVKEMEAKAEAQRAIQPEPATAGAPPSQGSPV